MMDNFKQPFYDGKVWNTKLMASCIVDEYKHTFNIITSGMKPFSIEVVYQLLEYENKLYCCERTITGFNAPYPITKQDWDNREFEYFRIKQEEKENVRS